MGPAELCWEGWGVDNTSLTPFLRSHSCGSQVSSVRPGGVLVSMLLGHQPWGTFRRALIYMPLGLQGDPGQSLNLRIPGFLICKLGIQKYTRECV